MKTKTQPSHSAQSKAFIDAARELGCDESEERFNEALRAVARHKPSAGCTNDPKPGKKPANRQHD